MDPVGAHQFWGYSPALDLQQISRTVFGSSWPSSSSSSSSSSFKSTSTPSTTTISTNPPSSSSSSSSSNLSNESSTSSTTGTSTATGSVPGTTPPNDNDNTLRILLLMPGDPRHVIKTIAQRYRNSTRSLHFYIYDKPVETLTRHLLLLSILCDWELPIRQRATTWLEVYGNSQLALRTARYLSNKRYSLIDLVCNETGTPPLASILDFSLLKARMKDEIENTINGYAEQVPFDVETLRDYRLRHNFGTRYDFRVNLMDWDYQSVVKKTAGSVAWPIYRDWRNTGRAFEFGDTVYDAPNRTMASYVEGREKGLSTERRGFWTDTVVSPFHAVGTACYVPTDEEAKASVFAANMTNVSVDTTTTPTVTTLNGNYGYELFDISSRRSGTEQWRHHAAEIATYNLLTWLYEIETGRQYVMRGSHDIYSGLADITVSSSPPSSSTTVAVTSPSPTSSTTTTESNVASGTITPEEHAHIQASMRTAAAARAKTISRAFRNIRITFLGGDFLTDYLDKQRFPFYFHILHLSSRAVHFLSHPYFSSIISSSGGVIITETLRNVPSVKQEQREEFTRRVLGMAGRIGCACVGTDRTLSADTFSVGSVIDGKTLGTNKMASTATNNIHSSVKPFECTVNGTFPGLIVNNGTATVGEIGKSEKKSTSIIRCKAIGFAAYSHNPSPLPVVQELQQAVFQSCDETTTSTDKEKSKQILADAGTASASNLRSYIRGVAQHDPQGGDNPFPEAIVFAYVPQVSTEIVKAINIILNTTTETTNGGNAGSSNTNSSSNIALSSHTTGTDTSLNDNQVRNSNVASSLSSSVPVGAPKIEILEDK